MNVRLDWRAVAGLLGTVLTYLAVPLAVPLAVGLYYGEDAWVFAVTMALTLVVGQALARLDDEPDVGTREGFLLVSAVWLAAALVGAVPFVLAGDGTVAHPVNALFESMSGFTTTGATVLGEISFEQHSHAVLMWRQLTQWLGGMGIVVLMIAILPELAVNGAELMQSEAPGPSLQKLTPRIVETARALWLIYFGFTALYVAVLLALHYAGLAPNMGPYNAVAHGFTTLPTGGFSPEANSIAAFRPVVQWVVVPFMLVAGVNFALFWHLLRGDVATFVADVELRAYAGAVAVFAAVLSGLLFAGAAPPLAELGGTTQGATENALRQGTFQIGSLLNSTGYATSNFAEWDTGAKLVLLFAMFVGGSAGSTGGGIKVVRWLVVLKAARRELYSAAHPDEVRPIRLAGEVVDEDSIRGIMAFTLLYVLLLFVSAVLIGLDSARIGYDLTTLEAVSASLATIGNIGPGFGSLGPFGNYERFSVFSKLLLTFLMWVGRLEIVPVLALLVSGLDR